MRKLRFLLVILLTFTCTYNAQAGWFKKKKKTPPKTEVTAPKKEPEVKGPKPFNQVITKGAKSVKGFIVVHKVDN